MAQLINITATFENGNEHESVIDMNDGRNVRIPRSDQPGIDDGLLNANTNNTNVVRPRRPSYQFIDCEGPGMVEFNRELIPDVNAYQHKKTLAQGMMDLALLSANANQLRYVLDSFDRHPYPMASLIFILISIVFQIAVGVGFILNGRFNIKDEKEICRSNKINNYTVTGIFIISFVNVLISSFGVAEQSPALFQGPGTN